MPEILGNQRKTGCAHDPVLFTAVSSAAATEMQSNTLRSSQRKLKSTTSILTMVSCQERQHKARVLPVMVLQLRKSMHEQHFHGDAATVAVIRCLRTNTSPSSSKPVKLSFGVF